MAISVTNPGFSVAGVTARAQCRHLAMIVTVSGTVDDRNLGPLTEHVKRFALPEKPLVVDLTGVEGFATQSVWLLHALAEACRNADIDWCIVPSPAVSRVLAGLGDRADFPVAGSVHEALHYFADVNSERKRILPLLTKTA
ncbi:STAS domain-containing protein [uncultured Mycolicibacterium sp.]|uniref:STAS domain-containing protein n=1 Tax=uncultured Mycolicibacterium sp. TaxID=2320817 RepID=UPI00262B46C0|nr:STAS domain-containing protein [uncultured Mycolicibacterium sp.]